VQRKELEYELDDAQARALGRCLALKRMPETEVCQQLLSRCDVVRCGAGVSSAKPTYACAYAYWRRRQRPSCDMLLLSVLSAWDVDLLRLHCTPLHCAPLRSTPLHSAAAAAAADPLLATHVPPVSSSWRREIRQGLVQIPHNLE